MIITIVNRTDEEIISCVSMLYGLGYSFNRDSSITLDVYRRLYLRFKIIYFTLNSDSSLGVTDNIENVFIKHVVFDSIEAFLNSNYNRRVK